MLATHAHGHRRWQIAGLAFALAAAILVSPSSLVVRAQEDSTDQPQIDMASPAPEVSTSTDDEPELTAAATGPIPMQAIQRYIGLGAITKRLPEREVRGGVVDSIEAYWRSVEAGAGMLPQAYLALGGEQRVMVLAGGVRSRWSRRRRR